MIEARTSEAQLRWRPSPLTLTILTCVAVLLAVAVIGSLWQLVAFAAPLLGVVCSIGWQRPVPAVVVMFEPAPSPVTVTAAEPTRETTEAPAPLAVTVTVAVPRLVTNAAVGVKLTLNASTMLNERSTISPANQ